MLQIERGQGTPVLAVHGFGLDHRVMSGMLEPVFTQRPGYRRLYPDLPGMGQSPADDVDGADALAATVKQYIDEKIGDELFLIVGQSYGAYLARALIAAFPNQVLGAALIAPVVIPEYNARELPDHQVLVADQLGDVPEGFRDLVVVQTAETLRRYRDEVEPGVLAADEAHLAVIAANYRLTADPGSPTSQFTGPTLVITGRQDQIVGYRDQLRFLDQFTHCTHIVLDGAGHNLHLDRARLVTELIQDWLDRCATTAGNR